METANFLGLWSLTSSLTIIFSNYNSEVFRSKGKPKLSVLVQLLHLAVLIPVLLIFADKGYSTLTVARSLVRLEMIVVSMIVLRAAIGMRFIQILKNVWPCLVSVVVMSLIGIGLRSISENIVYQFVSIFVCAVVYACSMWMIPDGKRILLEIPVINKLLRKMKWIFWRKE